MTTPHWVTQSMPSSSRRFTGLPFYTNEEDQVSTNSWMQGICASDYLRTPITVPQSASSHFAIFSKTTPTPHADQQADHNAIQSTYDTERTVAEDGSIISPNTWAWQGIDETSECLSTRGSLSGPILSGTGCLDQVNRNYLDQNSVHNPLQFENFDLQAFFHCEDSDKVANFGFDFWPGQPNSACHGCLVSEDEQALFSHGMPINETHWAAYEACDDESSIHCPQGPPLTRQFFSDSPHGSIPLCSINTSSTSTVWPTVQKTSTEQSDFIVRLDNDTSTRPAFQGFPTVATDVRPWSTGQHKTDTCLSPSPSIFSNTESVSDGLQPSFDDQTPSTHAKPSIFIANPPDVDMDVVDAGLVPRKQDLKHSDNLYLPRWIRGSGRQREAWCGCGRWLSLKRSTYWYHKNFIHGITVTGQRFPGPVQSRVTRDSTGSEGLCSSCERWIPLSGSKGSDTSWYRHVYKCGSMAALRSSHQKPRPKGSSAFSASPERRKLNNKTVPRSSSVRRADSL